jgi:hypothetical protein
MTTEIVTGHLVSGQTLSVVRFLYERAENRRAQASRDEARAKKILRDHGVSARLVVTNRMANLSRLARYDIDEADRLIEACPRQIPTDETWTG